MLVAATLCVLAPREASADGRADLQAAVEARDVKHDRKAARALLSALTEGAHESAEARDVAARASFLLGELDESERAYESALHHYRDVLTFDPGNWYAVSARARVESLESYGGTFRALARLDAVRKDPRASDDESAVSALQRDVGQFPPGRVRDEALLFIAEAYLGRLHRPADAVAPALSVAKAPAADPLTRASAFELAYAALHLAGDLDRAAREIAHDPAAPPSLRTRIAREVRRRRLHVASQAIDGVGVALLAWALVTASRRGRLRVVASVAFELRAWAFIAVASLGGYLIAERWESGQGAHFLVFGVALVLVHAFVASWRGAYGDRQRSVRALGGAAAAACVIAAAYLVLERGTARGAELLEGFGL